MRAKKKVEPKVLQNQICPSCGGTLVPINPLDPCSRWICVECVKKHITQHVNQSSCRRACTECG